MGMSPESIHKALLSVFAAIRTLSSIQLSCPKEAVKNNQNKFSKGYIISLKKREWDRFRSNFSTVKIAKLSVLPKAFTEKGWYLAIILIRSKRCING